MGDDADEVFFYDIYADVNRAAVYFDNEYMGDLSGGALTVRVVSNDKRPYDHVTLKMEGYQDTTASLPQPADTLQHVSIFLTMAPLIAEGGNISISSSPSEADIVLNGEPLGETPQTFSDLSQGTYTVNLVKHGYKPWTKTTVVHPGETTTVHASLEKKRTFGTISLNSDPQGADIYMDGWLYGTTPMTMGGIPTGPHVVELKKEGFSDFSTSVAVIENTVTPVTYSLTSTRDSPETDCALSFSSSPTGAMIVIDSVTRGMTPFTAADLTPGVHQIQLTYAGYQDYRGSAVLSDGETQTIDITLEPLPSSAPASLIPLIFALIAAALPATCGFRKQKEK